MIVFTIKQLTTLLQLRVISEEQELSYWQFDAICDYVYPVGLKRFSADHNIEINILEAEDGVVLVKKFLDTKQIFISIKQTTSEAVSLADTFLKELTNFN